MLARRRLQRISILYARGSHGKGNDQAHRVNDEVSLSTFDLLGCIETTLVALRRSTIGLSVAPY